MKTESLTLKSVRLWAVLVIATAVLAAPAAAQPGGNQIAGHWLIEGVPDPYTQIPPFLNVATLTRDGQMINVDPGVGTSVGGWERLSGHRYAVTFTGFLPGPLRYVVRATVTLGAGGQHLSGPYRTDVLQMDGSTLFSYGGTVNAWRQAVEPY